jgi:hypothetical protein
MTHHHQNQLQGQEEQEMVTADNSGLYDAMA